MSGPRKITELPVAVDLSDLDLSKGVVALTHRGEHKRVTWDSLLEAVARRPLNRP